MLAVHCLKPVVSYLHSAATGYSYITHIYMLHLRNKYVWQSVMY